MSDKELKEIEKEEHCSCHDHDHDHHHHDHHDHHDHDHHDHSDSCSCHDHHDHSDSCSCHDHHDHDHHHHDHGGSCSCHSHSHSSFGPEIGCSCCSHDEEESPKVLFISLGLFIVAFILNFLIERQIKINGSYSLLGIDSKILLPLMFIPIYILSAYKVIGTAFKNIAKGEIFDENFLMMIASVGAMAIGAYPEAVAVMIFYNMGEFLQDYAIGKSKASIADLMDIRPDFAVVIRDGEEKKVFPENVALGEEIIVRAGERIPLDGTVIEGNAELDMKALTGESLPVSVEPESKVISGSINTNGVLRIKTTKLFNDSTVSKILELVESSAEHKSKTEKFITKFAKIYTPVVVFSALALVLIPTFIFGLENFHTWLYRGLTFLVTSCPCALVISIPLTYFAGIGGASSRGVLIKGANYIDVLSKAETVVFDKTGTLTHGNFSVSEIKAENIEENDFLLKAALMESFSNHPIGQAFIDEAVKRDLISSGEDLNEKVKLIEERAGKGLIAEIEGLKYYLGNPSLMKDMNISCNNVPGAIHLANEKSYLGYALVGDTNRKDADIIVKELKKLGVKNTVMLTGDSPEIAEKTAKAIGIDSFKAGLLPGDKVDNIEKLLSEDKTGSLVFIGDGINDAPVLARADVGIAMGGLGSDAAIEAADIVLMTDELMNIPLSIKISRKIMKLVKQNIAFILTVKVLVLILAALGIAGMWTAVFADVGVALLAIINAMRAMKK